MEGAPSKDLFHITQIHTLLVGTALNIGSENRTYDLFTVYFTGTWEKQRLKKYVGPINCILHTFNEHGLRGLYHGSHIMLYR